MSVVDMGYDARRWHTHALDACEHSCYNFRDFIHYIIVLYSHIKEPSTYTFLYSRIYNLIYSYNYYWLNFMLKSTEHAQWIKSMYWSLVFKAACRSRLIKFWYIMAVVLLTSVLYLLVATLPSTVWGQLATSISEF